MAKEINWNARAVALELLAFSLRYPDDELVESLMSGEWQAACDDLEKVGYLELSQGFANVDLLRDADGLEVEDSETFLHVLRAESTRLFIGAPNPVVSPFEGIWRAADDGVEGLVFANPHTMDVARFMRSCGIGQSEGVNVPLDHVATELEFMQYLSMLEAGMIQPYEGAVDADDLPGGSAPAAYDRFFEEHAQVWMDRFAAKVAEESRVPYYRAVAQLLASYMSCN